jgi:signal transduction histidine kinase
MNRVLIVDDKADNRYMLRALLQGHGYVVDEAGHGAEALVRARQAPPALIITDLLMPVMDGYSLLKNWKADEQLKRIPFVVYTATYTDPKDERLALDLGADAFIVKPAEPEPFMARILEVLARKECGELPPRSAATTEESVIFKEYNEVLVRKLEDKALQLEEANRALRQDIAERESLEKQLRQAQKMEAFGQLAGGVAHDFNNLMTVVTSYCELLLKGAIPPHEQRDVIREILKAGERAAALTRQLLAFSRKQLLQPIELDLNRLIRETEKMLLRLIGEDIDLTATLDPALAWVKADPGQIEQVIMNLIVNARDAMPTGGHLTIETRNVELDQSYAQTHPEVGPGNYVMLAVADSGRGMDDATKSRLFEPFFTTKEPGKGTGLGLATVHGIVKQSGGSIEVYSEAGRGTTFKVYLPRIKPVVSSGTSMPDPSLMPQGTETILLAEDEAEVRAAVRLVLATSGYTVLESQSVDDALRICRQHQGPIHLLMTDVVMPKMSGRQLAESVVALLPKIKVLYISGYTDDAVVRHGVLEAGMPFLQKPFTPMVLARKVREVLGGTDNTELVPPFSQQQSIIP